MFLTGASPYSSQLASLFPSPHIYVRPCVVLVLATGASPAVELTFTNLGYTPTSYRSLVYTIMSLGGTFIPEDPAYTGASGIFVRGMDCTVQSYNSTQQHTFRIIYNYVWANSLMGGIPPGGNVTCVTTPEDVFFIQFIPAGTLTLHGHNYMRPATQYGQQVVEAITVSVPVPRSPLLQVSVDPNACRQQSKTGMVAVCSSSMPSGDHSVCTAHAIRTEFELWHLQPAHLHARSPDLIY